MAHPRTSSAPVVKDKPVQTFLTPFSKTDFREWGDAGTAHGWSPKLLLITGAQPNAPFTIESQMVVEYAPEFATDESPDVIVEPIGEMKPRPKCPSSAKTHHAIGQKPIIGAPEVLNQAAMMLGYGRMAYQAGRAVVSAVGEALGGLVPVAETALADLGPVVAAV
jgi:hypothetical protein